MTKTNSYTLDPASRVDTITSTTGGTESQRLKYRYGGGSDSPSRIDTSVDGGVSWSTTRNIVVPGVGFVGTDASVTTWQLSNLHGDVTATQPNTAGVVTLASNTETDEYGVAVSGTPGRYGYLGVHQRSDDALGGLTLMGVRLYNPGTGNFLSNDPVLGGTPTRYAYPTDSVNYSDPRGLFVVAQSQRISNDYFAIFTTQVRSWQEEFGARFAAGLNVYFGVTLQWMAEEIAKLVYHQTYRKRWIQYGYHRGVWSKRIKYEHWTRRKPISKVLVYRAWRPVFGTLEYLGYFWIDEYHGTEYGPISPA